MSAADREKKFVEIKTKQREAASKLSFIWPNYISRLLKDGDIPEEDRVKLTELKSLLKEQKCLPTDLLQYRDLFRRYVNF